jgi:mannose-6-phosphate isomerase-like protein (cupin superfamily)
LINPIYLQTTAVQPPSKRPYTGDIKTSLVKHQPAINSEPAFTADLNALQAKYLTGLKKPLAPSFGANKALSIARNGISDIFQQIDGGYMLDLETKTVAYFGDDAKRFLKDRKFFPCETQIICPDNGHLSVTTEGKTGYINQAGAILTGKEAEAEVKVLDGDPIVITTQNAPLWYEKALPDGPHKDKYNEIIEINKRLMAGDVLKECFKEAELTRLINSNIIRELDNKYVHFNYYESGYDLSKHLDKEGFTIEEADIVIKIWLESMHRQLLNLDSGVVSAKLFKSRILDKLVKAQILMPQMAFNDNSYYSWQTAFNEKELRQKLLLAGIWDHTQDEIVSIWKHTTNAGYDHTGLVMDHGKVVIYALKHKANIWNQQSTEWLVNSLAFPGKNEPFTVGVSQVTAPENFKKAIPFKKIRPSEALHLHPASKDKHQTEVYYINNGEAALLTMQNNKPRIQILKKGDMALIHPGVPHCVMAVKGNYEHSVFQIPSAFQYGFALKEEQKYEDFGITEKDILHDALKMLDEGPIIVGV